MSPTENLPDLNGQKILITGGLGFIGSNLAVACLAGGAEVTVYDCLDPHAGGNFFNIDSIRSSLKVYYHDILDYSHLAEQVASHNVIINCAASTSHPFSMREPWIDLDINSRGVINILEAMRRFNRNAKFIHLGTSTQLGKLRYQPADENHPEFPTDIYSANKSVSEKYVLIYANAYQMRTTVVRLANVYGPRASIHSSEFTFNNYFVGLALQNKDITVFGDGKQKRNVMYVDDAVAAIIKASQSDTVNGQAVFAVSDDHYSLSEIATATAENIGGRVKFVEWPPERKAVDVGDAVISNGRIKELLDWRPLNDLCSGLRKTKAYYQNCLHEYLR